jgi:LytS/YehU family sensor histidine kinase
MLPGTYLGFRLASAVFPFLGQRFLSDFSNYTSGMITGSLILGVIVLAELHRDSQEAQKEARWRLSEMEKERLQAQIAALTAQMNPHLLFNALNTIAAMIPTAPEKAEEMTVMLSELYRGVLGASKRAKHSLTTEIEICKSYLGVEQARFGERLTVQVRVAPDLSPDQIQIPVLTLQPLVENAVRHGISPKSAGGQISLSVNAASDRLELIVEDDGVGYGQSPSRPGSGTGIFNCRERLRLHYGEHGRLRIDPRLAGGTLVTIEIPRVET